MNNTASRRIVGRIHAAAVRASLWEDAAVLWEVLRNGSATVSPFYSFNIRIASTMHAWGIIPKPIPQDPYNRYIITL